MTLANVSHASNITHYLVKATPTATRKTLNCDVSIVPLLYWKKIESHLVSFKWPCSTNKSHTCCIQFCCKFCQLHFCQILFKLVFISYCNRESNRGELFFEIQCTWWVTVDRHLGVYPTTWVNSAFHPSELGKSSTSLSVWICSLVSGVWSLMAIDIL